MEEYNNEEMIQEFLEIICDYCKSDNDNCNLKYLLEPEDHQLLYNNDLPITKTSYKSSQDYFDTYNSLITALKDYYKKYINTKPEIVVRMSFDKKNESIIAKFPYKDLNTNLKLTLGNIFEIKYNNKCICEGRILSVDIYKGVELFINYYSFRKLPPKGRYSIKEKYNETIFKRMLSGIYDFANNKKCCNEVIYSIILGYVPRNLDVDSEILNINKVNKIKLDELNEMQKVAFKQAIIKRFSIIQGPPGTGKTKLSSFITYYLDKFKVNPKSKILLCASSNLAADNLTKYLISEFDSSELKIVRFLARCREMYARNDLKDVYFHI